MQTPYTSKKNSLEVPRRKPSAASRTAHQMKMSGSDAEVVSSLNPASKTQKERSPKVNERKALRSPVSETKRKSRVSEQEAQLNQLQDDLKKAKDQLTASESWKRRAMQEAEEAKKQLSEMSAKLEESEQQLLEFSASEDDRVQELSKISQDRDRAWQSELEAVQKQQKMDSAALASALNEIRKLKVQLEKAYESEAIQIKHAESAYSEIHNLRIELTETLDLVEKLKSDAIEVRAIEVVNKTEMQLDAANKTIEVLRSDATKGTEAYNKMSLELEESKARVESLEGLVSKLNSSMNGEKEETEKLKTELSLAKLEVGQLRSALDAADIRYQEEYIRSTLEIRSAYEQVECIRTQSCQRESELELKKKLEADLADLKANLTAKEIKLQSVTEQLEAAEAANNEMEGELRRIKVQTDQWRKAAEAATAMLSTGNDGKHMDRIISFDTNHNLIPGSPNSEDMDDDSPKKKNGNMFKKIGVLWKKGQK